MLGQMLVPAGAEAARMRSIVDRPMPVSWLTRYLLTSAETACRTRLSRSACQLQAAPGPVRPWWLRLLLAIDGGEIALADLYPESERTAGLEAGS
jgi:hypothetical protein